MAVNLTTKYVGEVAEELFTDIMLGADSIAKNLFKIYENVGSDVFTLAKTETEDNLIDYTCNFDPQNDVILSEIDVRLKAISYMLEICKTDMQKRWSGGKLNGKLGQIPANELEAVMNDLYNRLSLKVEKYLWTGDSTIAGQFDGFLKGLTPVTYDRVDGIEAALEAGIDAMSEAALQRDDFKIIVSNDVLRNYSRELKLKNFPQAEGFIDNFKIETANGLPAGTIVMFNSYNLNIVTNFIDDMTNISTIDMENVTGDHSLRVRADWKIATAIIDTTDVVYMTAQ